MIHDTAFAKINLALHVRRRRGDGYHELETLFAFVDAGDRLTAQPADGFTLDLTVPFNSRAVVYLPAGETVAEGGSTIWTRGAAVGRREGVAFRAAEQEQLVWTVGSGTYRFTIK